MLEAEVFGQRYSIKKVWPTIFLKMRLWRECFPVNFTKLLRTPFLKEHLRWLLLLKQTICRVLEYLAYQCDCIFEVRNFTIEKQETMD